VYPFRILSRLAAEGHDVLRGGTPTHARLRDRLVGLAITTVAFDLLCSVLALVFERHQPSSQIETFGSAVFWASTQLLTVSSNLSDPVSTPARLLDVFMEIYAITVTGSLAGVFGAFLIKRGEELDAINKLDARR
jgi:hypothetical protein